ncbi:hypothetical protein GE061_016829 [Apolygus lucorum]|uniref:Uncharacterized protein n=1 Tax=Apolygus lucorum TaxID=248454 RepID=A0A8S9XLB5_APOLU|nr:hypothetical protein GE061_016829 [Apolygus lucorum]
MLMYRNWCSRVTMTTVHLSMTNSECLVRDVLKLGLKDKDLQERLFRVPDLTLNKTVELCRAAELGRNSKTKIPVHYKLLEPEIRSNVQDKVVRRTSDLKRFYDRNAKTLSDLSIDDRILVWDFDRNVWEPGIVVDEGPGPRSYFVKLVGASTSSYQFLRNRKFLRKWGCGDDVEVDRGSQSVDDSEHLTGPIASEQTPEEDSTEEVVERARPAMHTRPPVCLQDYVCQ